MIVCMLAVLLLIASCGESAEEAPEEVEEVNETVEEETEEEEEETDDEEEVEVEETEEDAALKSQGPPILTVQVVDAVTKQPIEKASVNLREVVACIALPGVKCREGIDLNEYTDTTGKAYFTDPIVKELLKKPFFTITVLAKGYSREMMEIYSGNIESMVIIEIMPEKE